MCVLNDWYKWKKPITKKKIPSVTTDLSFEGSTFSLIGIHLILYTVYFAEKTNVLDSCLKIYKSKLEKVNAVFFFICRKNAYLFFTSCKGLY